MIRSATEAHPESSELALYARLDLPLFARLRVRLHIRHCARCRRQCASLSDAIASTADDVRVRFRRAEAHPAWRTLRQDMTGNIAVGLAAAQCIEHVGARRRRTWLRILAVCGAVMLLVVGWMTHIPSADTAKIVAAFKTLGQAHLRTLSSPVLSSTVNGITVSVHNNGLKILTAPSAAVFCSGPATLRSSYVDEETGQSTITSVYSP